jgi:hypothetical protein
MHFELEKRKQKNQRKQNVLYKAFLKKQNFFSEYTMKNREINPSNFEDVTLSDLPKQSLRMECKEEMDV